VQLQASWNRRPELLNAERNGCAAVLGIALGPNFLSRMAGLSLVRPFSTPIAVGGEAADLDSAGKGKFKMEPYP
jgi:hypothetical protein